MNFFAGANTRYGFKSVFENAFSGVERLFIIKGSSGCGKSTLMKRVALSAEAMGFTVDYIYCSADSNSLDGIIIKEKSLAVADGTSPHVMDVKYPCVRESIINLGEFWDEKLLLPRKAEIMGLTDLKSCHYKNAYKALASAGHITELKNQLISNCINRKRLEDFAFKLYSKAVLPQKGNITRLFATAFTCNGIASLEVFNNISHLYRINGTGNDELLTALLQITIEKGERAFVFNNPICPELPQLIYYPKSQTAITTLTDKISVTCEKTHNISAKRFCDKGLLTALKNRLKGLEQLKNSLLSEAETELAEAKSVHNQIEAIYIPAMDFDRVDKYTENLIKSILG